MVDKHVWLCKKTDTAHDKKFVLFARFTRRKVQESVFLLATYGICIGFIGLYIYIGFATRKMIVFLLIFGSIFANPPKVGTMGYPIPAKFFLVILYVICSKFFVGCKSLK
jgi:hypothetical protein